MTDYINHLLCDCAPENGPLQDAIEHAIVTGLVTPVGDPDIDRDLIITQLTEIRAAHHQAIQPHYTRTLEIMGQFLPADIAAGLPFRKAA